MTGCEDVEVEESPSVPSLFSRCWEAPGGC